MKTQNREDIKLQAPVKDGGMASLEWNRTNIWSTSQDLELHQHLHTVFSSLMGMIAISPCSSRSTVTR